MALKQADRVRETSTTTGTGAMALAGAPSGYRTFSSVLSDGDTCTYAIALDADWEVGVGTYNSSGNTLTRTTVTASSNAGAAVNWGAGSKSIFISPLASDPAFSEELRVPAGSVGAPAIQPNDDPNTGISFPAPDTVAISEGGEEVLRVNSSGEVIVGNGDAVASPASRTLRGTNGTGTNVAAGNLTITPGLATGNASSGALIVETGPAGSSGSTLQTATERLRVTATGRLGVGTNAPATTFDLAGAYSANVTAMGALDVDCSAGNYFTKTINGNSTFTVSNVPASRCYSFTLELTHTSGTITWFSGVEWPGGAAPSLTTGKTHLFMFLTDDGGTRWRASALTNYTT